MKKIILIIFVFCSVLLSAQTSSIKKIHIYHTYENLYVSYIAPLSCSDNQDYGPIIITDSLIIRSISNCISKNKQCNKVQSPDVRFKIELFMANSTATLCFGQSGEGMYFQNKKYKYNPQLCSLIIRIIEESGAKKPQKVLPPM